MGELDEAIRAHLELKRRHGASDAELRAEEQEALGPVRRDAAGEPPVEDDPFVEGSAPPGAYGDEPVGPGPYGDEPVGPEAYGDEPVAPGPYGDEPVGPGPYGEDEAFHSPADEAADFGHLTDEAADAEGLAAETTAVPDEDLRPFYEFESPLAHAGSEPDAYDEPPDDEPPPAGPTGDTPARGFAAVDEPASPDEAEPTEDVLEETPDFLQETPEHDRLWFEQKPPREFDFDGE